MKKPTTKAAKPRSSAGPAKKGTKRQAKPKGRPRYVIGNWKMIPQSLKQSSDVFKAIRKTAARLDNTRVAICPPFVHLTEVAKLANGAVRPGVQDIHWEASGSYTGEISAAQARDAGADYALVGHSERRAAGETDRQVAKKAVAAIGSGLTAVICVGEKERDIQGGQHLKFIEDQIRNSFENLSRRDLKGVILAYEPVWAIGRPDNEAMTGKDLYEMSLYIRKVLMGLYGKDAAFEIPILYGGSVTAGNAEDIVREGKVDGLLVGRQSVEPEGFSAVLRTVDSINYE